MAMRKYHVEVDRPKSRTQLVITCDSLVTLRRILIEKYNRTHTNIGVFSKISSSNHGKATIEQYRFIGSIFVNISGIQWTTDKDCYAVNKDGTLRK